MRIKNLDTYIEKLIGAPTDITKLGTNEEPLYTHFKGKEEELDSFLREFCSFAASPCEQVYYEYIQNAYDNAADRVMFFINEQYLLIVNNGNTFYTGYDFKNKNIKGQFHRFLALHSSNHPNNPNGRSSDIGKYGQGSKLIYTLLADEDFQTDSEDSIYDVIVNQGKSPYLISWSSPKQLDSLFQGIDRDYIIVDPEDADSIIFTKIMMGYYPLHPNKCDRFNQEETSRVLSEIKSMIPNEQLLYLDKGTAILIPLGKGISARLKEDSNIKKVTDNASIFLSLYKSYKSEDHKLEDIFIDNQKIGHIKDCVTVPVTIEWGGETVEADISFSKQYENGVNLFKALPIVNSKLKLCFVVNTSRFETDNARQNLKDRDKSKELIRTIFKKTVEEIEKLDTKDLNKICDALLCSSIVQCNEDPDNQYITEPFKEFFLPLLLQNIPTQIGTLESVENVVNADFEKPLDLQVLGINKKLVSNNTAYLLKENHNKDIEKVDLAKVVASAEDSFLEKYILSLNDNEYSNFISIIQTQWNNDKLASIKLFKSNLDKVYSFAELQQNNILFYTDDIMRRLTKDSGFEHIVIECNSNILGNKILFNKIKSHPEFYCQTVIARELACYILSCNKEKDNEIKSIALLKSKKGERLPFNALFSNTDEKNKKHINSDFIVDGLMPKYVKPNWFCQDWKQWVYNNFAKIKQISDWNTCHSIYVYEIIEAYRNFEYTIDGIKKELFPLYLNDNFVPDDSIEQKSLFNANKLTIEEYNKISSIKPNDLHFIPFNYCNILSKKPFLSSENKITISDLIDSSEKYELPLVRIFFKLNDRLLQLFIVKENSDGTYEFQNKEDKLFNVLNSESLNKEQRDLFEKAGGIFIPQKIENLLSNEEKASYSPFVWGDSTPLFKAVTGTEDPKHLFDLIKGNGDAAVYAFLDEIELNINEYISENDIRWNIIKHSINNNQFITKTRNKILINGKSLPENMTERRITCNDKLHDVYELLECVKNNNILIESMDGYLSSNMRESFVNAFYKNIVRLTSQEVFDKINKNSLTMDQLKFCMDYANESGMTDAMFKLNSEVNMTDALHLMKENKYKGFEKFLYIPNFSRGQVYAQNDILLQEEILPQPIFDWIQSDEKNLELLETIHSEKKSLPLKLRRCVWNDCSDNIDLTKLDLKDNKLIERTSKWLVDSNKNVIFKSNSFNAIDTYAYKLLNKEDNKDIILLQVLPETNEKQKIVCKIVDKSITDNGWYYIDRKDLQLIQDMLNSGLEENILSFFAQNNVAILPSKEYAGKFSITDECIIHIAKQPTVDKDAKEWNNNVYKKWSEDFKIKIYITPQNVSTNVVFKSKDKDIRSFGFKDGADGYEKDKYIIIKDPQKEKTEIKFLTELSKRDDYSWFDKPFIELLSMFLSGLYEEDRDKAPTRTDSNSSSNQKPVPNSNKNSKSTGSGNISVSDKNKDLLIELDKWSSDLLEWIKNNKMKIKQIKDDEEPQIKVLCGYLGERIYEGFMNKCGIKVRDITDKGYADFEKGQDLVDVKTNIGSIKSGSKTIHLHKTTQAYLNDHPENMIHIFHISLTDIGFEGKYKELEKKYGKSEDPRQNEKLKAECEKLVIEYWKNKDVEEFKKETFVYQLKTSHEKIR